jgi:FkbM family methyltransferase
MGVRRSVRKLLQRVGIEVVRYNPRARQYLFAHKGINLVFDVGANVGQYGEKLRAGGYHGRIVSFEPLAGPFEVLERRTRSDPAWTCFQLALGDTSEETTMNVYGKESSSLLELNDPVAQNLRLEHGGTEDVIVKRFDDVMDELAGPDDPIFVKLDVQGFELPILRGAEQGLARVQGMEIELSLAPLYQRQALVGQVIDYLEKRGFRMIWLETYPRRAENARASAGGWVVHARRLALRRFARG